MAASSPGLGSPVVHASVLQVAREVGMDISTLRDVGSEAWNARVQIWSRVMRTVRLDGFPIRVAQRYSVGDIGALGMVADVAPDLRAAFTRLLQHQHVLCGTPLGRVREDAASGTTVLEIVPVEGNSLGARCRREMLVASGLKFARDITGVWVRPRRVCFTHSSPRDRREHEAFFDCEVRFGADYDGLDFDRDTFALALPHADPELSRFLVEHLRSVAGEPTTEHASLESDVRRIVLRRLGRGDLSMAAIARELGMSTRTLRRRLLERDSHYREILDGLRREIADTLLLDPDHKISEVAFQLGFSDPSAFHRAYVRWTGQTPSSRRREQPLSVAAIDPAALGRASLRP